MPHFLEHYYISDRQLAEIYRLTDSPTLNINPNKISKLLSNIEGRIAKNQLFCVKKNALWETGGKDGLIVRLKNIQKRMLNSDAQLATRIGETIDCLIIDYLCRQSIKQKMHLFRDTVNQRIFHFIRRLKPRQAFDRIESDTVNQELPFIFWSVAAALVDDKGRLITHNLRKLLYVYDAEEKTHARRIIHAERLAIAELIIESLNEASIQTILPTEQEDCKAKIFEGSSYRPATNSEKLAAAPSTVLYAAFNILPEKSRKFFSQLTLYTSLEPCLVSDQNPSCSRLASIFGFKKVVLGTTDFPPENKGTGVAHMQRMGTRVEEISQISQKLAHFAQNKANGDGKILEWYYKHKSILMHLPLVGKAFQKRPGEINPFIFLRRKTLETNIAGLRLNEPILEMLLIEACDYAKPDSLSYDQDGSVTVKIEKVFSLLSAIIYADEKEVDSLVREAIAQLSITSLQNGPIGKGFAKTIEYISLKKHRKELLRMRERLGQP